MASNLFDEDVVRRTHRGIVQFGLVIRNYEGYSSLEDDSEDEEDMIKKGHVRVAWYPKGREETLPENKVTLYDRSVMPGDAVRRMSSTNDDSQRGIVRSVNVACHIQSSRTRQMIYDVPSSELTQLLVFQPGRYCVLGSWIGIVRNVFVRVIVRLKNGSRCALSDEGASRLTDVHDNSDEDSVFSYQDGFYPGQILRGPACAFKNASWLSGTQPILSSRAYFKVTVEEVNVVGLDVHWQTRGLCKGMSDMDGKISNEDMQPPARKVPEGTLPEVKPLNYFVAASVQIGDKAMYAVKSEDLHYPQPVPRGAAACFVKPPLPPTEISKTALQNLANSKESIETKIKDSGIKDTVESSDVVLEMADSTAGTGKLKEQSSCSKFNKNGEKEASSGTKPKRHDVDVCDKSSDDVSDKMKDDILSVNQADGIGKDGVCKADGKISTDCVNDTGNEKCQAPELSEGANSVSGKPQDVDLCCSNSGNLQASCQSEKEEHSIGKAESELDKLSESKLLEQCKEVEAVQNKTEKLHNRAAELKTDLSRDVDLLTALHSDLCEASESIVKIADSFKPLLQRASTDSAKEISGHVTRLLDSRERLNEQINLTEGLLKGGKKTIGVLQHIADNRKPKSGKSKNRGKDENADSSTDEYVTDDDDDAGSHTGSIGSIGSNASGKGSKSRPKVVSSRLLRHNRSHQPRLLSKKRPPPRPLEVGERVCTEVTHTWTLVDVMWQDGTREKNIVSADLFPAHQLDELEFFPGDFVTRNNENIDSVYGLVCKADHKERTCLIQWIMRPNQHTPLPEKTSCEEVSVYELSPHPDFTFNGGDIVVRIATSQTASPQTPEEQSCAGQVLWVNTDGSIHVAWADSTQSSVLPQDLYKLEEDSDSEWSDFNGGDDDEWEELDGKKQKKTDKESGSESGSSWETASGASFSTVSSQSGDGENDAKSEGTKSTSTKILDEAAKEETEKNKKDTSVQSEQEMGNTDSKAPSIKKDEAQPAEDGSKNIGATASVETTISKSTQCSPVTGADESKQNNNEDNSVQDKNVQCACTEAGENLDLHECVGDETLAQLSVIEDKMNQLCTIAHSLLVKKQFMTVSKDGKDNQGGDVKETDVKKADQDAKTGIDNSGMDGDGVKKMDNSSGLCDEAAACVNTNVPPVEGSEDGVESKGSNSAIESAAKAVDEEEEEQLSNFILLEDVHSTHIFKSATFTPEDPKSFATSIKKEMKLLKTSLPQGIIVKAFSDRMDLFSVLFEGPDNTPYEDGLFFFDVRLPPDYPRSPPIMHFHAYCSGRLNPNLYNDGKVCVSLLGTWTGKGNEMWTSKSNLMQVLVSIQGLILVQEPYYNEAGYEKHRCSQLGLENSRMYNETAVLKLIQSMQMMVSSPPEIFREETLKFCRKHAYRMIHRVEQWLTRANQQTSTPSSINSSSSMSTSPSATSSPAMEASSSSKLASSPSSQLGEDHSMVFALFPLFPLSRGFLLSTKQALRAYRKSLHVAGIDETP